MPNSIPNTHSIINFRETQKSKILYFPYSNNGVSNRNSRSCNIFSMNSAQIKQKTQQSQFYLLFDFRNLKHLQIHLSLSVFA